MHIDEGTVKCWGNDWYGQLGNGISAYCLVPSTAVVNFPALLAPMGLAATSQSGSVGLSWNVVTTAVGYEIQVATNAAGLFSSAAGTCASGTANIHSANVHGKWADQRGHLLLPCSPGEQLDCSKQCSNLSCGRRTDAQSRPRKLAPY